MQRSRRKRNQEAYRNDGETSLSNLVAFDVETVSSINPEYQLQPWRARANEARISCYAFAWATGGGDVEHKIVTKSSQDLGKLKNTLAKLAKQKTTIVGWNVAFDIAWLIAHGMREEVFALKWLDAMNLWKRVDSNRLRLVETRHKVLSFGLKTAVAEFLPQYAGYGDGIDFNPFTHKDMNMLREYNELDARYTLMLANMFLSKLTPVETRNAKIESACLPLVADSVVRGLTVDTCTATKLSAALDTVIREAFVKLRVFGTTPEILASPAQLADLLYNQWGLPKLKLTPAGRDSTDKETLHELSLLDARAKVIHQYREAMGNKEKFVAKVLASAKYNGDGTTHPQMAVYSTYTGRATYFSKQGKGKNERQTGVALHQIPRQKSFRELYLPPEGFKLLEFDAAGQEFRWMACASMDETMLGLCAAGEDAHAYMGAQIAGLDYRGLVQRVHDGDKAAKDQRQLGKVANLSLGYRTSAKTLLRVARVQYGLPMELVEATKIHTTYARTYPGVARYWKQQIANCRSLGYAESFAGRRVQLCGSWIGPARWELESTAINYRIQGTGADQKYLALMVLRDYLPKVGGYFYFDLHDAIFVIVPHARARQAAVEIKALFDNLPYKQAWGYEPPIRFPWDAKIGSSWGDLKEAV